MTLADLTIDQLSRIWNRLYREYTRGKGYQPFGFDWTTLAALDPSRYRLMRQIHAEVRSRKS